MTFQIVPFEENIKKLVDEKKKKHERLYKLMFCGSKSLNILHSWNEHHRF